MIHIMILYTGQFLQYFVRIKYTFSRFRGYLIIKSKLHQLCNGPSLRCAGIGNGRWIGSSAAGKIETRKTVNEVYLL